MSNLGLSICVSKNKEQVKMMLIGSFYGMVFIAQMIAWTIINHMRDYEKSMWFVTGIATLMTVITCSMYLLFRRLFQISTRCSGSKVTHPSGSWRR